jgi:TRAP-type uncharacterized transport system substrate-binding protein
MRLILIALACILATANRGNAEKVIAILTGSTNGVYYPLGTTLSSIYAKAIPGASVTAQATQGSAGNKEAGFDAPYRKLRAIAKIYPNFIQVVAGPPQGDFHRRLKL